MPETKERESNRGKTVSDFSFLSVTNPFPFASSVDADCQTGDCVLVFVVDVIYFIIFIITLVAKRDEF